MPLSSPSVSTEYLPPPPTQLSTLPPFAAFASSGYFPFSLRIPPGEPTDGAAVKMPCTPDWERLLNEPCADAIMHQINHSPDSVVFDPYGSLRFEEMPSNAADIGSNRSDEITGHVHDYVPLPERFGGSASPPKPAEALLCMPSELSHLGSKRRAPRPPPLAQLDAESGRRGPRPRTTPGTVRAGVQKSPAGDVSVSGMTALPPGTDHAALVASVMAAVRYYHRLGKPHLNSQRAARGSKDVTPPSRSVRPARCSAPRVTADARQPPESAMTSGPEHASQTGRREQLPRGV